MSYYGGGGGWGPPPNVGAPGQVFYNPNQGQVPPQQQQVPGYLPPAAAGFTQAQGRIQYSYAQVGYGNYGHPPPPIPAPSSTAPQPSAPQPSAPGMMGSMAQSAQYSVPPPALKQTSAGETRNRARSSPERSRDSYSPPRRRSPTPDDRYERRSSGTRGRDNVLDDYRYRPSERLGRKSPSRSPDDDRHYSLESRSRRKSPEAIQDKFRKSRKDVNALPKEILQKSRSDQSGVDIDSLLKDERLRNVLFAGISKATAKLEQSLKEKETNDDISFLSASASGEKSHLFPSASSSSGSQQKLRSILKRKPDPDEGGDVNKTFSHLSTLEKTLHMLRGKPDMGDSSLSSEQSQTKADSKSHGALGQLSSYDDDNDEESYLYGDRKESSFEKKKKRLAVHPFWSVDAVNVNEDNKEPDTFEMKEKLFEKWRQSIQKSPDGQSIPPKDSSRNTVFEKSNSAASRVSPVQGNKDDGQEELDSTVQNILQSIGFDFDLSQRMQQLARKKKFQEVEKSAGISNQSASFLGKSHNLSEELKASLLQSGNDLSQIDSLLQEARASARRDRATRQREDSLSPVGRSRRDRSPDVDRAVSIRDRLKGRHSPSEWSDQDDEPRRPSRQRLSQNYEPLSPKESFFNEDRMLRPAFHISKSVREDDVRDEYFYPEKDLVDLPPGVPLLTSYNSRQKNEDLSSGLLKSMRVENFRVMSKPVYDDDSEEFTETRRIILPARSDRKVLSRSPSARESRSPSVRGTQKRLGSPLSVSSLKERRIISSQSCSLREGRPKSPDYDRDSTSPSDQRRPSTGHRSPSLRGAKRSPSPRGSRRSPSPRISRRSPSPRGSRRSPSPRGRRSPSPRGSRRSPSPRGSRRSPSPRGSRRSPSPRGSRRSRSPRGLRRSPSPRGSKYRSRRRSRSPDGQRPKSPRRYRSRSPVRHRSRSPRRRRSRSNSRPRFRDMRSPLRVKRRPFRRSPEKNDVRKSDSKISVDKKVTATDTVKRDGTTTKGKNNGQSQNVSSVDCSKMTDEERKVHLQKLLAVVAEKNVGSTLMLRKKAEIDCQNILESFEKLAPTIGLEKKADMINKLTQLSEKDRSKVSSNVNERFAKVMALKFEVVKFKKQQNELMRKNQRSGKGKEDPQLSSNERAQLRMEREIQRLSALELEVEITEFSVEQEDPSETRQARGEFPSGKTSGNLITVAVSENVTVTSKNSEKTSSFTQNAASLVSKNKDGKRKVPPTTGVTKDMRKEPDGPSSSNTNTWKTVDVKDELPNIADGKVSQGVDKKGKPPKSGSKSTPSTKKKIYYEYIDSGNHFCRHCHITCNTLCQFFEHAHGKKHARAIMESPSPWDDVKNIKAENRKVGQAQSRRVKGTEMMFPVYGFYCRLCKLYCGDFKTSEKHLKSDNHYDKYLDYIKDNPRYEKDLLLEKTKDPNVVSSKKKSSSFSEDREGKGREKKAHLRVKTEKDLEKEDEDIGAFDKIGSVDMELDEEDHRDDDMDVESKVPKMVPKPPPPFVPPPPPETAYEDSMKANKEDEVQPLDTFLTITSEDTGKAVEGEKIPVVKSRTAVDVSHIPMPPMAVVSPVGKVATRRETLVTVKSLQEVQAEESKAQEAERKAMEEEKRMMGIDVDADEEKPLAAIKRPPMLENLPAKSSEDIEALKEPVKPPSIDSLFAKLNKNVAHKRKQKLVSAVEPERNEMEMRIQQEIAAKVNKEKEKLVRIKLKEEERERRREERRFQKKKTCYSDLSSSEDSDSEEESAADDGTVISVIGENKHQVPPSETVTAEAPNATKSGTQTHSVSDDVDSSITNASLSTPADATNVEPATGGVESHVVTGSEENVSVEPQERVLTESTEDVVMMESQESVVKEPQTSAIAESEDNEAETKEKNLAESGGDEVISVVEARSDSAEIQRQTRSTSSSQALKKRKAPSKKKSSPLGAAKTSESDLFGVFSTSLETVSRDAKKKLAKKSPARKRGRGAKSRQLPEELGPEEREIDMGDFVVLSEITDEDNGSVGAMATGEPKSAFQPGLEDQEDAGLSQELPHDKVQTENNERLAKSDQENLLNVTVESLQSEDGKNEKPIEDMEVVDMAVKAPFVPAGDDAQEVTIEVEAKQPTELVVPAAGRGGKRGRGRKSGGRDRGRGKRGDRNRPVVEEIVTPETEDSGTIGVESRKLEETENSAVESKVEEIENSTVESKVEEIESSTAELKVEEIESSTVESKIEEIENSTGRGRKFGGRDRGRGKRGDRNRPVVEEIVTPETEDSGTIGVESRKLEETENSAVESKVEEIENSTVESKVEEIESSTVELKVEEIESSTVESKIEEIENIEVESTKVEENENCSVKSTMVEEMKNSAVESTMVGEIESCALVSTMVEQIEKSTVEAKEEESQNGASQAKVDDKERSAGRSAARRTRSGRVAATSGRVTRSRLNKKQSEPVGDESIISEPKMIEVEEEKDCELSVVATSLISDETDDVNMTLGNELTETIPDVFKDSTNEDVVTKDGSDSDATITEDAEDIVSVSQVSSSYTNVPPRSDDDIVTQGMQIMCQLVPITGQSMDTSQGQMGMEFLADQSASSSCLTAVDTAQIGHDTESSSWNQPSLDDLDQEIQSVTPGDVSVDMPVLQEFVPHLASSLPNQPRDPPMSGIVSEVDAPDTVVMEMDDDIARQEGHGLECDYDEGLPTSGLSLGLEAVSDSMSFPLDDDNAKTDSMEPLSSE